MLRILISISIAALFSVSLVQANEYYRSKTTHSTTKAKKADQCKPYGDADAGAQMCGYTK